MSSDQTTCPIDVHASRRRVNVRTITRLDAGLVPPQEFPLRRWFYATPLWYLHRPATTYRLKPDAAFWRLVDPQLRTLCQEILRAGLYTTPSCQRHFTRGRTSRRPRLRTA